MAQSLRITYGAFIVGGTTGREIVGPIQLSKTFEVGTLSFQVLITGTSDSIFAANCAALEAAYALRRLAIKLEIGSSTNLEWDPAGLTPGALGFDQTAVAEKSGTPGGDTIRSRLYDVALTAGLPATDQSGRRDSTIRVDKPDTRQKIVTITGAWTAAPGTSASDQYAAEIDAYVASVLSGIDGSATFERIEEATEANDTDSVITFVRRHRQKTFDQSDGTLDDPAIVEDALVFTRVNPSPGDSGDGDVKRLTDIRADYACSVNIEETTDLQTLYDDTIRPFLIAQFVAKYSPNEFGIVTESFAPDFPYNRLSATIVFTAAIDLNGDTILSLKTTRIVGDTGVALTGAWTGGLFDKYVDQGIASKRRFTISVDRKIGSHPPNDPVGTHQIVDAGYQLMGSDSSATESHIGPPGEDQILVTDILNTTVEDFVTPPTSGALAGPDTPTSGDTPGAAAAPPPSSGPTAPPLTPPPITPAPGG